MNKTFFHLRCLLIILACWGIHHLTHAQVSIGLATPPAFGALLDLKSQQAGTVTNVDDNTNITSTVGGLLLPRVKLISFSSLDEVVTGCNSLSNEDKLKLAGLMVYNINRVSGTFYLGVYVWNGTDWAYLVDSKVSSPMTIIEQPKEFSFYEEGTETAIPLEFKVNPPKAADGTVGTVTYQWYQLTGNNVHARVGTALSTAANITNGSRTLAFTPAHTIKGTTRIASNAGFYRFYCVASGSDGSTLRSETAEVAVGCGAKNNLGEWISFMCFNLGADNNSTIASQKSFSLSFTNDLNGIHTYQPGEEELYGSLFQWGRIPDGHELRMAENPVGSPAPYPNTLRYSGITTSDIGSGLRCTSTGGNPAGNRYPTNQVLESTTWYGKFIYATPNPENNWNPITVQTTLNNLWTTGGFLPNDPCMRYLDDGTYKTLWHTAANGGTDGVANPNGACVVNPSTGWRTPSQAEWGEIYKGGSLTGTPAIATANTWIWYINGSNRGYEIKPDGQTATLLLPASGGRNAGSGLLYIQSTTGYYWSSSIIGTNAYLQSITNGIVNPANTSVRSAGFALRCIKNQ